MNYGIFRSQPIMTINDLAQIGSHNKREKKAYKSNPNIKLELTKNNIELIPLAEKYVKGFKLLVKDYEKEHNERMKTERPERKKTFNEMLNKSKSVVADELMFTATHKFFDNMSKDEIMRWADTCMDFVYNDLGYKKEQILHATIHMDELTPHIHCVVVPLVKKLDKRTNTERLTISKKQYIKGNIHLSELQDIYNLRLRENSFELERGIKGSDRKHQKVKEFKKTTRYYEDKVTTINKSLDNAMNEFEEKMKTTKNTLIDKEYVKVRKDTFDSIKNVIKETKKVMEFQTKMEQLFNEVNTFSKSHQTLEKENNNLQREVKALTIRNQNLTKENNNLKDYLKAILKAIKHFLRELLQIGNEKTKERTTNEIKDYYDNKDFDSNDVYDISKGTTKEDELFDYADVPSYLKTSKKSYDDKDKDDYEISI
ncbi:MAG: hypothetical protein HFG33_04450 [Bacilli bacterium]|nr:hypothetical protein [Bacilli bacterium]